MFIQTGILSGGPSIVEQELSRTVTSWTLPNTTNENTAYTVSSSDSVIQSLDTVTLYQDEVIVDSAQFFLGTSILTAPLIEHTVFDKGEVRVDSAQFFLGTSTVIDTLIQHTVFDKGEVQLDSAQFFLGSNTVVTTLIEHTVFDKGEVRVDSAQFFLGTSIVG